jgi:hypothetical protein
MRPWASRREQYQGSPESAGGKDRGVLPAGAGPAASEQEAPLRLLVAAAVAEQRIVASMLVQRKRLLDRR